MQPASGTHVTYKSHVYHWQAQIPNFCLDYQTITLQGHFRLALHKFRPHLAFLCLSCNISRTTQRTNTGQIPACSQEPVDSTDANMVETSTCLERPISIESDWSMFSFALSVQSSYRYQNILRIGEVLGHRIDAKISPKAASEKAQTTVSENTYTFPNIDVFRTAILSLLATTGNNARASFLVHQVLRTSATVLWYRRMFTQFSLRV